VLSRNTVRVGELARDKLKLTIHPKKKKDWLDGISRVWPTELEGANPSILVWKE